MPGEDHVSNSSGASVAEHELPDPTHRHVLQAMQRRVRCQWQLFADTRDRYRASKKNEDIGPDRTRHQVQFRCAQLRREPTSAMADSRPMDAYEIVFLSLNYCATANYATHIELRIHLDNICKFSSLKAAHSWIAQDLGALS